VDPDISIIESLSRNHLQIPDSHHLTVKFDAEGAFNKIYTIFTSGDSGAESQLPYIFRVTLPVEPFYKTASEVATLTYIRQHTSIPVPRVVAFSSTAENELGFEWILMDKVPGVSLKSVWREMEMEAKERNTRVIARYVKQLHNQCSFDVIGNLYFRHDIPNETVRTVSVTDDRFVIGPTVTTFMFAGGRKLRLPRNLGPYSDDAEYMAALADAEAEDIQFLQSPGARTYDDFDEDLAEEAPEIMEAWRELQRVRATFFPSHLRSFALSHHDLSLSNILVDPTTYEINGIIDWECTGTRPGWEDRYPEFLEGPEREEKPEPLSPGDDNEFRVEQWEDWEKTILRPFWNEELGNVEHGNDAVDKMRLDWRRHLDWLEISAGRVMRWIEVEYGEWIMREHDHPTSSLGHALESFTGGTTTPNPAGEDTAASAA
jgi:aminoglycoside phosphotransferase